MYLNDLYARSPRMKGFVELGQPYLGLDALRLAGIHTTQALTMPVLAGTPDFGTASKEYLILALADEVDRLNRLVSIVRLELCKEAES